MDSRSLPVIMSIRTPSCEDDDEYWMKSNKKKGLFDDDDEEDSSAKEFAAAGRKSRMFEEADSDSLGAFTVEVVEAEPASKKSDNDSLPAMKYQRAGSARNVPAQPPTALQASQALEEPSPSPKTRSISNVSQHSGYGQSSITEVVAATVREPTKSDIAKLEAKIKRLEIQLEAQNVGSLAIEETIKRILCGKTYHLESYKSLEDKKHLLRCALATHDGNTSNTVILFLRRSLTRSVFQNTLVEVGGADQYVSYLKQVDELSEAEDIVSMIGKSDEAAMTRYQYAVGTSTINGKVQQLKNCQKTHFELDNSLADDCLFISDQISLLEVQRVIEEADVATEAQGRHPIMRTHKRRGKLPNQPLLTTLYYSCLYHYDQPPQVFSSPQYLLQKFKLTDVQLQWIATAALGRICRWTQIDGLFAGKKWYGASTMNSAIGFHNIVKILHKAKAAPDVLDKYCALISDEEVKLKTAQKYSCHNTAIDTLVAMKDRAALTQLRRKLPHGSTSAQKASAALQNSSIKWKN